MKTVVSIITIAFFLISCSDEPIDYVDKIYQNGTIITMDDSNPLAAALATKNGLIQAVGTTEAIQKLKGPDTEMVDLADKTLVPGFIDAHSHFAGVGVQSIVANLLPAPDGPVNSIEDLQRVLKEFHQNSSIAKDYGVIIGFNYDDSQLKEQRHPTRQELDVVSTELPVVVMHQSGHLGAYNSKALELMGITSESVDPPGGVIEREADGKTPSGVMQENAHFMLFFKLLPQFSAEDMVKSYQAGEHSYVSNGFTTVQEGKSDLATLQSLPQIAAEVGFSIDIISYPDFKVLSDHAILRSDLMSSEYQNGFRIGGVKLTFDGSPQGKTAWFTEPYLVPPAGQSADYAGYPAFDDKEAYDLLQLAYQNNWQIMVHTNGDAAVDQLLQLVGKIAEERALGDHRTVMIHGQFTREDQVAQLKALGIFPALYPMHTFYWGDWHRDSVAGPERANNISPTGWMLRENIKFSVHSDAPVTFPNSMRLLDSVVNRTTRTDQVLGEEHRVTPMQALKAMTIWPAYQHYEEKIKGSLEVGKQADFVILDRDPLTIEHRELKNIKVLQTINNDQLIYDADS